MNKWRDTIQDVRKGRGLTQVDVAHKLEVDPSTVRNLERSPAQGIISVAKYMDAVAMTDKDRLALLKLAGGAQ